MIFTKEEQGVVLGVFGELLKKDYSELNSFLGSLTIAEMTRIYAKLKYEPYCEKHGIKLEDMTEDDFMREYEERAMSESEWYDCYDDSERYNDCDIFSYFTETEDDYYGGDYEY